MTIKHYIGLGLTLDGAAVCHCVEDDNRLIIHDFWQDSEGSGDAILQVLDSIFSRLEDLSQHQIQIYAANSLLRDSTVKWCKQRLYYQAQVLEPVAPPRDSAVFLASELRDRRLIVLKDDDLEPVKLAFRDVDQDDDNAATGSPQGLAVLFCCGEAVYQRLQPNEAEDIADALAAMS